MTRTTTAKPSRFEASQGPRIVGPGEGKAADLSESVPRLCAEYGLVFPT